MNLANIQSAYYMVAATGVLIGVIYYIINLRSNTRARTMEIVRLHTSDLVSEEGIQRSATMMNLEWKDFEDFMKKYWFTSNIEIFAKWAAHFSMLEASGILIKNKVVKPELFYDLGGCGVIDTWEKHKDVIQRLRKDYHGAVTFNNAEFFIQEMQKIKTQNAGRFNDTLKPSYRAP